MVIPWLGFPLAALLKEVEPLSRARYVRFESLYDPERMPGQKTDVLDWPSNTVDYGRRNSGGATSRIPLVQNLLRNRDNVVKLYNLR